MVRLGIEACKGLCRALLAERIFALRHREHVATRRALREARAESFCRLAGALFKPPASDEHGLLRFELSRLKPVCHQRPIPFRPRPAISLMRGSTGDLRHAVRLSDQAFPWSLNRYPRRTENRQERPGRSSFKLESSHAAVASGLARLSNRQSPSNRFGMFTSRMPSSRRGRRLHPVLYDKQPRESASNSLRSFEVAVGPVNASPGSRPSLAAMKYRRGVACLS